MGYNVRLGHHSEMRIIAAQSAPARRLFLNCSRCKAVQTLDFALYDTVVVGGGPTTRQMRHGLVRDGRWMVPEEYFQMDLRCACGGRIQVSELQARYSPEHICNDKCVAATRNVCECSCGGVNHGGKHRSAA